MSDLPDRRERLVRALHGIIPPLVLASFAALQLVEAATRSSYATLGRDQGIFQYVAWAIGEGDVAYRDVRDVNGPLVPLVHLVMQGLGGADERVFRLLDLAASAVAFAFVSACLVDLGRDDDDHEGLASRVAWGAGGLVALGAQYLCYGFWDTAQRESFFDWFVLIGIGAGLAGQRELARVARGGGREGRAFGWIVLSGAASTTSVLGKPTYLLFALAQLATLLAERMPIARRRRALPWGLGASIGLAVPLVFLAVRGDVGAWLRITLHDVPSMYRFIWPRPVDQLFAMSGYTRNLALALAGTASVLGLVGVKMLPARALALGLAPSLGLLSVVAQAKGFPYHFHPVSAGTTLAFLAVVRAAAIPSGGRTTLGRELAALGLGVVLAAGLGMRTRIELRSMPWPEVPPPAARTAEALEGPEHLAPYVRVDFFPHDLRRAAAFLREHTRADERVQTYGMDAYLLFLARRRSATPFIYAYDLNVDAALAGASVFGGPRPTDAEQATIRAMRDAHERELLARMKAAPPAAFVFVDRSPLMAGPAAIPDFDAHCPDASRWVRERYEEAADFDGIHVWLRRRP